MLDRFRNLQRPQQILLALGGGAVVVALVVILVAAVGGDSEPAPTTTSAPTTTTTMPPPAPLTGLPERDAEVFSRPSVAVKIGNNPEARPQAGLNQADVIYEEEVEGRITRFLAVFHSEYPERVGPVRSVRLMDSLIARPLGGIFVYSGGANVPERVQRLEEAGLRHFSEGQASGAGATVLDRSHGNGVRPNILFLRPGVLAESTGLATPPPPLFQYLPLDTPFQGEDAPAVRIPVGSAGYNPTWRWNEDRGVWQRFYGDEPFLDKSGDQVAVENLIVQFVDRQGEESLVLGGGEAAVLAGGKIVQGTWERPDADLPARYYDEAGREIRLVPGRTWVALPLRGSGSIQVLVPEGGTTTTDGR